MRRSVLPSVLLAVAIGVAYLLIAPDTQDYAAAVFRADLFSRAGFVVVNDAWYGGHHIPSYSLLMPPLGAWVGPRLLATLATVAAAWVFAELVDGAFPRRGAMLGAPWFAIAVASQLFTGRVTFLLGLPFALGALLAIQRGRPRLAIVLAVLTGLTGPVDAAFLALAGIAFALAGTALEPPAPRLAQPRNLGLLVAIAAAGPVAALFLVFPEGGTEPFVPSAFWPALITLAVLAWYLPKEDRVLRAGAALYALTVIVAFIVPTALGGNVTRLAALVTGPLVVCALWPRQRKLLLVLAVPFLYWQLMPAIRDVTVTDHDPSTHLAYYTPLIAELQARHAGPIRIEVPFTRSHWEAARLTPHVALARGWERQLDRVRNPLFYDAKKLNAATYTAWLHDNAVKYVALPDARLDISATAEAALIRAGVPALRPVWHSAHWTLYAVRHATPIGVTELGANGFTMRATHPGVRTIRVRFSPHWAVVSGDGCVSRSPEDYTLVRALRAGTIRVAPRVDPVRAILGRTGPRCRTTVTTR